MNKYLLSALGMASGALIMLGASAGASAQGASGEVEKCKWLVDHGKYFETVGECVSHKRKNIVDFCKKLKDKKAFEHPWFIKKGIKNQGQCIKFFRDDY